LFPDESTFTSDELIDIIIIIEQSKIHVGFAKFHISINDLSMSDAIS